MKPLIIGSRGSRLALIQAQLIVDSLKKEYPLLDIQIRVIKTTGDHLEAQPIRDIDQRGIFTKEIENKLLEGEIDLAVHSLKDLQVELHPRLVIAAIPPREDPRDCWISLQHPHPSSLQAGAIVVTGSPRRANQLLRKRPDLRIVPVRGNVESRLRKLRENRQWQGTVLALAGIKRLGIDISSFFCTPLSMDWMLPAPGQGALALQARIEDKHTQSLVKHLNDFSTACAVTAERVFLHELGGGCRTAVGARAEVEGSRLVLEGIWWPQQAIEPKEGKVVGEIHRAEDLGKKLADLLKNL
ncbi:hydroxymethylbilane synthase [Candidatus Methylacidiphilum infernorum]|uniref:Hydroxymethylbilane synthase n=1 Tax=Methylacidiphilum infernorum (isolate V4) TaxID=481448 RepID=B3DZQ6_METI4|nr:hydroxymethylbilane synthase [Candidatus Methylacidiphilum infernorum]ACD84241.1 Porphobilinogen deaminase [Methylacidiphilum infernorum V4]